MFGTPFALAAAQAVTQTCAGGVRSIRSSSSSSSSSIRHVSARIIRWKQQQQQQYHEHTSVGGTLVRTTKATNKSQSLCRNRRSYTQTTIANATAGNDDDPNRQACHSYLTESCGIVDEEGEIYQGILKAMQSVYGKTVTVKELQAFGVDGMKALAASVQTELARKQVKRKQKEQQQQKLPNKNKTSAMISFVVPHHQTSFDLPWLTGDSLLDVAHDSPIGEELLGEYMEGTCGGTMSCCTCHIYLDSNAMAVFGEPTESEMELLDLAYEPRDGSSRLGCQVVLRPEHIDQLCKLQQQQQQPNNDLDQNEQQPKPLITVTIPADVVDMWK